jgi:NAD(P)-dependent dehydrogenase (short-subunit alcohol dehydrogenase family)
LLSCVIDITAGTAGLGAESVFQIAQHHPATVYFTGRSATSAQGVIDRVKAAVPDANIVFVACDLTSLASVKAAAERVLAETDRLDVLICNAGIMATPPGLTQDGYELQFGVNHLGHALLVQKLLPTLRRTAISPGGDVRIVVLTSHRFRGHPSGGILFDTLRTTQDLGPGGPWLRYGQSKLANVLYARELARRVPELTTIAVHPGLVGTGLTGHLTGVQAFLVRMVKVAVGSLTLEQGAYTQLWAAFGNRLEMTSGKMYEPVGVLTTLNATAQGEELAQALWTWTEEALKEY